MLAAGLIIFYLIGVVIAGYSCRKTGFTESQGAHASVFWPFILPLMLFICSIYWVKEGLRWVFKLGFGKSKEEV